MKYLVILGDGMADLPVAELGGLTPLQYAATPAMDAMARVGEVGLVQTVPPGMQPGSDVANLAILGYDPAAVYTGRAPLEALGAGVPMEPEDAIFRCNFVTLSEGEPFEAKRLLDHSAGELATEEAEILMEAVRAEFASDTVSFYGGVGYRRLMRVKNGRVPETAPPHLHLGERIGKLLPDDAALCRMTARSYEILERHPFNVRRAAAGKNKANAVWFWGAGRRPALGDFTARTGLKGVMVSAVDLLKGIAAGAGLAVAGVAGATGLLETNYEGKADAAVRALLTGGMDFAYLHVEAPDEMGHQGSALRKVRAIEYLDRRLVARVKAAMDASDEDYRLLLLPDHPTPVTLRSHTGAPVPYLLYDSRRLRTGNAHYSEADAAASGNFAASGAQLLEKLISE